MNVRSVRLPQHLLQQRRLRRPVSRRDHRDVFQCSAHARHFPQLERLLKHLDAVAAAIAVTVVAVLCSREGAEVDNGLPQKLITRHHIIIVHAEDHRAVPWGHVKFHTLVPRRKTGRYGAPTPHQHRALVCVAPDVPAGALLIMLFSLNTPRFPVRLAFRTSGTAAPATLLPETVVGDKDFDVRI